VASAVRQWTASNGRAHGYAHAELFHRIVPLGATRDDAPAQE
jgi:hypothetical protein